MIRSKENNIDKRPFALFNSLPLIPSIRSYYGKTKHSNFIIERGCNIAEATIRPVYQLSEPTLRRLDEYANDKVRRSRLLVHNAYKSAVKTAVWPASYLYGYASHGLDLVADTPVGHVVEGAYDVADEVIDNILPAAEMEGEESEDDKNMSSLDKKSPVRRVYRRINSESIALLPSRTISYSKKLSHSMSDRALSHALDVSAFLVNRSYYISTNVASTIISATPGSKFVVEKIGSHLVPSEKLAKNLKVVLSGVLGQLKVWHRRANKAHMQQTVELIDTVTILMKSLQDKVATSEETRQGAPNSKEQKSRAPIHPSVSQLNESRYLSNKHRLEDNEAPRDKKARTVEGQSLNDVHPRNKEADGWKYAHYDRQRHTETDSHEEVHGYDSDDATQNNPFGLLSALSKQEDESRETEDQDSEQPEHVLTYAEVVQHPAEAKVSDPEPNESEPNAEKPAPATHNKTSYATIVQRPPVVYVDPIVAAHQKEAESYNWHQVDHAHAAHGIKELEAPLKPVEVDNPFLGLNVESPHIPEAKHKQHKHHAAKPQTPVPVSEDTEADSELDEGWQVVPSKRHHDVYMTHERLPQEWKDAIQNPFDALTNEESKEAQIYKCILDEYLDMVDSITPHDAVRHDKLTHILKRKAALMSNARRTTATRQARELAKEQQFEQSRMDGEGAAVSHALPAGFVVSEPEELEASRMDAEGGAVSHAIPAVSRTETTTVELEKTRMDAEGAAVSSAIPTHVHTDVFVDSHHSFADVVKSGDVHTQEKSASSSTPAHAWAHVDSTHTFADVVKAGVASL